MLDRLDVKLRDNGELIPGKNHKKAGNALRWAKTEAPRPHHGNIFATKSRKFVPTCAPPREGGAGEGGRRVSRPRGRPRECVPASARLLLPIPNRARPSSPPPLPPPPWIPTSRFPEQTLPYPAAKERRRWRRRRRRWRST